MKKKPVSRRVEIFLDVKATSQEVVSTLDKDACPDCKITILDIGDPQNARRAARLGIRHFPTIVINGKPLVCCTRCPAGNALSQLATVVAAVDCNTPPTPQSCEAGRERRGRN